MTVPRRIRDLLAHRHALRWTVALAAALVLPSLGAGLVLDDLMHRTMLEAEQSSYFHRPAHDLYAFLPDDDAWRQRAREDGGLPWYTGPRLHTSLWRPLASLSIALDHTLWPGFVPLAHLHSVLWYAALVLAVGLLYRRLLATPWVAALAGLMYALDDAHGFPTGWIANRNGIMSMVFGVTALLMYVRWRQERGPRMRALWPPLLLLVGLLCSEMALSVTAYMFAHAMFLQRGSMASRLASLLPCVVVCVAWRVVYLAQGYGVGGSSLYIDPMSEPLEFLKVLPWRLVVLLQGQLMPINSEGYVMLTPQPSLPFALVALGTTAVTALVLWRWARGNAMAGFWLTGMVVSALPACATFPHDRLLFPVGIGAFGMVAQVLAGPSEAPDGLPEGYWRRMPVRALTACWLLFHLVLGPLLLPVKSLAPRFAGDVFAKPAFTLDRVDPLSNRTLVYVTAPGFFHSSWAPLIRHQNGRSYPPRIRILGTTFGRVEVTRTGPRTLRLRSPAGFASGMLDSLMYTADRPFRAGQVFRVSGLEIRLGPLTERGRPAEMVCRFARDLEHRDNVWTAWHSDGYRPFVLPRPGQTVVLPATSIVDLVKLAFR